MKMKKSNGNWDVMVNDAQKLKQYIKLKNWCSFYILNLFYLNKSGPSLRVKCNVLPEKSKLVYN